MLIDLLQQQTSLQELTIYCKVNAMRRFVDTFTNVLEHLLQNKWLKKLRCHIDILQNVTVKSETIEDLEIILHDCYGDFFQHQ